MEQFENSDEIRDFYLKKMIEIDLVPQKKIQSMKSLEVKNFILTKSLIIHAKKWLPFLRIHITLYTQECAFFFYLCLRLAG